MVYSTVIFGPPQTNQSDGCALSSYVPFHFLKKMIPHLQHHTYDFVVTLAVILNTCTHAQDTMIFLRFCAQGIAEAIYWTTAFRLIFQEPPFVLERYAKKLHWNEWKLHSKFCLVGCFNIYLEASYSNDGVGSQLSRM